MGLEYVPRWMGLHSPTNIYRVPCMDPISVWYELTYIEHQASRTCTEIYHIWMVCIEPFMFAWHGHMFPNDAEVHDGCRAGSRAQQQAWEPCDTKCWADHRGVCNPKETALLTILELLYPWTPGPWVSEFMVLEPSIGLDWITVGGNQVPYKDGLSDQLFAVDHEKQVGFYGGVARWFPARIPARSLSLGCPNFYRVKYHQLAIV